MRDATPFPTLWDRSRPGRRIVDAEPWPGNGEAVPEALRRQDVPNLPELGELELVRHFTGLAHRNISVDETFYPLGSCTMKYNPKVNEEIAWLPGFGGMHPAQDASDAQGTLAFLVELAGALCGITGMADFTLQPAAGAHGELTGLLMMRAAHIARGDVRQRVLIPDSAHGTNPASVALAGYAVDTVPSRPDGQVDVDALRDRLGPDVAAFMITNPSTHGVFERNVAEIADAVHDAGALLYYDGANLNAIVGRARPGDMGFDVVHVNLHKTFSVPHGGGGPGAGPVGVAAHLVPFLPGPQPTRTPEGAYTLGPGGPQSIGRVHGWLGNVGALVRAAAYIRALGAAGLRDTSARAVLNANYVATSLAATPQAADLSFPFGTRCMHEFVVSLEPLKKATDVVALDVAKRLLDHGFHPPTMYFPTTVREDLMIEPTETEAPETLDAFVEALAAVLAEARTDPDTVHSAPHTTPVGRVRQADSDRHPVLRAEV